MSREPVIFVVDDDEAVRAGLKLLIESVGLLVETYGDAEEFLRRYDSVQPGCLVLDVRMPGMSGLDLQQKLQSLNSLLPIIFITGHGDVPNAVRAMRDGAVDFIQKPFREQELLDRIQQAIAADERTRSRTREISTIRDRLSRLTTRENEVLDKVVEGSPNKAIAYDLGVSERTVEIHRSRVMKKMEAGSLPELVQMVMRTREAQ